ncbi:type II toxin-antitoxin system Phd/YefM family antitoxin [Leptospira sp. 201903074]|uniref:type II toxin-antitoxin system Phd/YefM family antitoxin n=1 Tax=Leptospira abararensis TaxID=2810036 RepID=UPI001962DF6B|nr:type II toxin-antitoxin system Phd/YefM family antitoxin [Leptospira abararensis]MBM9548433.1 type II toxin-antitoxin system Phd/YefM family antitoxin [Leptospira abararensis]
MKSIGIKDLKNNLSSYLEFVKKGETILILDRNNPIAEIKKFSTIENKTELYIKESTENNSIIPAKKFKTVKIPKSRTFKGLSKEDISKTWKSIYNEERS